MNSTLRITSVTVNICASTAIINQLTRILFQVLVLGVTIITVAIVIGRAVIGGYNTA